MIGASLMFSHTKSESHTKIKVVLLNSITIYVKPVFILELSAELQLVLLYIVTKGISFVGVREKDLLFTNVVVVDIATWEVLHLFVYFIFIFIELLLVVLLSHLEVLFMVFQFFIFGGFV
jgi:hypothetical protein